MRHRRRGISVVALVFATSVGMVGSLAMTGRTEAQASTSAVERVSTTQPPTSETSAGSPISAPGARQQLTYAGLQPDVVRSLAIKAGASRAGGSATPNAPSTPVAAADPAPLDKSFTWQYGKGFDTSLAPSLSSMTAWLSSPYRSIGIYVGGSNRLYPVQPNLTASWVRSIATLGWRAQPIYEGLQAPCTTTEKTPMTPGQEAAQGEAAALDAIAAAKALGIGLGSDIYYDMEAYPRSTSCSGSVRLFLSSWTVTLKSHGYSSGVYSSLGSGIQDIANGTPAGFVAPDKIWIAHYDGIAGVYGYAPYVADSQWAPYRRIHQYLSNTSETYGGVTINIDKNFLDTDPRRGNPFGQVDSTSTAPGKVTARGWALDPDTSAPIMVQMYIDGRANALTWASQPRPDVAVVYPATGPNHGFTLTMSTTAGPHTVCLYAINTGPGVSVRFGCRTVNVPSSNPFGQVDSTSTAPGKVTARGWALDPDTSAPIMVQMYIDGRANALTWASQPRPDVAVVYPAAGPNHGFTLTMSTTAGPHTVCLYAINTGPGVSVRFGCRTVTVP